MHVKKNPLWHSVAFFHESTRAEPFRLLVLVFTVFLRVRCEYYQRGFAHNARKISLTICFYRVSSRCAAKILAVHFDSYIGWLGFYGYAPVGCCR